ncbi:hypothetical protein BDR07DRAFT_1401032 [Suillus spraguei]|nr:hypothetical protein BDR07DRAFT_1401032 [Suillus spraguei]
MRLSDCGHLFFQKGHSHLGAYGLCLSMLILIVTPLELPDIVLRVRFANCFALRDLRITDFPIGILSILESQVLKVFSQRCKCVSAGENRSTMAWVFCKQAIISTATSS